jgi:PAS domain S-box-containing protein
MQRSNEHRLLVERSALLESAADGIYAIDPAGLCTFINRAAGDMLGYTPEECIGRDLHSLVHSRHADGAPYPVTECPIYRTVVTGQGARIENEVAWHKDGHPVPVEYSTQPIVIQGVVEGAVVTMRDVTHARGAREALASSERRLRLALSAGRMGAWFWNARTNSVQWDTALELIYGLPPGSFGGTYEAFLNLVHPEDRARVIEAVTQAGQQVTDYEIEFRIVWPSGEVRWISDRGQVLFGDGGRLGITGVCWDATDRKRGEQELEASRRQVASILESITDGFAAYDRQWRFTYVNPEGARLLHQTPDELIGKCLWDVFPDVVHTPLYTEAQRAIRDQVSVELEQYSTRFGLWWSIRIFPSTQGATFYYQDITARKRMERRRLAQYSVSRVLASALDIEEALHKVLEAAATHLGYSSGRVASTTWNNPPTDPTLARDILQSGEPKATETALAFPILAGGKVLGVVELHHTGISAPEPELLLTATVLGNQIGQFLQRKQAEQELRDSEARNRAILQTALDCIVTIDSSSRILEFNPAAEQTFGHARAAAVGRYLPDLIIPPALRDAHRKGLARYLATGDSHVLGNRIEVTALHADGHEFPIELAVNRIPTEGAPLFTAYIRDIAERKQHEEALKEAKAASEAANQAKSQFLASMSHELRTPLNAIIGYSEMLEEEVEESGAPGLKPDLQKIHSAGKHLLELINEVLDLSKIEAGRMELFEEDFNIADAIREIAGTVLPLVQKNGNHLEIHCAPDLGSMHADLTKFRQSVLNLLSNACKFTENGAVTIAASRHANLIRVQVSDTGIGIAAGKLQQLFEPFSQADASTSRNYGGTGLGLALSRRFSRLMGGDLTAHSEEGKGAAFTIEIPAGGAAVKEPAPAQAQDMGAILVVDDDPTARDLIQRSLDKEGFHTVAASNGPEALRLARQLRPRAITLDVMMPGMDGWAVLGQLKADPETCDIPVVMVTILEDCNLAYSLGATDYLTKPIDRERLAHVLRKHHCAHLPCHVLLVEDDQSNRELLRGFLEREDWTVVEAEDGAEALARLNGIHPQLILLDLMMPHMDGFEVVAELKKNPAWSNIPVVVITAKDVTEEDRRRLNGQVERILSKGALDRDSLLAEVRRVVSHVPAAVQSGTGRSPHPAIPE